MVIITCFDTTSRASNLPLIDFVKAWLAEIGMIRYLVHAPVNKANLFATIPAVMAVS